MLGILLAAGIGLCSDGIATWPVGPDGRCHLVDKDRCITCGSSAPAPRPVCKKGILVLTLNGAPMCAERLTTPIMK